MTDDNLRQAHRHGQAWGLQPVQSAPNWWLIGVTAVCLSIWGGIIWWLA